VLCPGVSGRKATLSSGSTLPAAAEAVLTFLENVGRRSEAELYLRLFRELPRHSFALVVTDAPVVRHALGSVLEQLRFLADLGLVAPVLVGAFNPESSARGAAQLAEHLPSVGLTPRTHELPETGLAALLSRELDANQVPVLRFPPRPNEDLHDRFQQIGALAGQLSSRKVVLLRQRGSLKPRDESARLGPAYRLLWDGGQVAVLNLRHDLPLLTESGLLRQDDATLAKLVGVLLDGAGQRQLTVSVTEPWSMLRELFTVKGAGTLIKMGTELERHTSYATLDRQRLTGLLERSFGRQLAADFFARPPLAVYLEPSYRGAAILEDSEVGPFLTKFAVEPIAQGEGIGQDLWQALTRDHHSVLWRAAKANPINGWYATQCDGLVRLDRWHVFWRGLASDAIPRAIEVACTRPEDFAPSST
jgi:GNAT superfamily N-acetyltransferase